MSNQPHHSPQGQQDLENTEIKKLFIYQLSEVISLEHNLYTTFQEITRQAKCLDLKLAMREHELEVSAHHQRLKEISGLLNLPDGDSVVWPIFTLFSLELNEIIKSHYKQPKVRDLVLITFAKKVKGYEIACYHNLKHLASLLDMQAVHQLLLETFDEKEETRILLEELSVECYKNPVMYPDAESLIVSG